MHRLQSALVGTTEGDICLINDAPVPRVSGNKVIIKVKAVAVNPVDSKMLWRRFGPDVRHIRVGDRVSTAVMGMNPLNSTVGAFATGTAAIQLLHLAGYKVITTCSPHNFDLVRGYGADTVFDYKAADCVAEIKKHTRNKLKYVLDCISTMSSMQFCYQVLGRAGGKYTALEPFPESIAQTRKVVKADWVFTLQVLGHEIAWRERHHRPADPAVTKFGDLWTARLNALLKKGALKPHPLMSRTGGLGKVMSSIDDVRSNKISGRKIVVSV